jgi:hypothetical protein
MFVSVFDRDKAVDPGPFPLGAPVLDLLERGSGPAHEAARRRVEAMLAHYPEDGRATLVTRLKTRVAWQSNDTFFELFVLSLFLERGFTLVGVEQPLPHTGYVVDFTFAAPGGALLMVEVVCYNPPHESIGPKKRLDEVINAVDAVESAHYQVALTKVTGAPAQSVARRALKASVAQWLRSEPAAGTARTFSVDDSCSVTLTPSMRDVHGRAGLLVAPPALEHVHHVVEGVRRKLYQKAYKYGSLNVPLIVALNVAPEMGVTPRLFDQAVYGPEAPDAPPRAHLGYPGEYVPSTGALLETGGPLSQIPAVIGFLGVTPFDVGYERGAVYCSRHAPHFDLAALGLPVHHAPSAAVPQSTERAVNP